MGLDNMPHKYPCETQGTAVMEIVIYEADGTRHERIDCVETVAADGCPFTNAKPPPGQVVGMLGTFCWYRGKYGNWLIRALNGLDPDEFDDTNGADFYGTDEDGIYRQPHECNELARAMEIALAQQGGTLALHGEDVTKEVKFAIWYLRWTAAECEGMDAWF